MTREEKVQIIEELSEKFSLNNHYYFTDASGLKVEEINSFRQLCFDRGVEYKVYKNTLVIKALEKIAKEPEMDDLRNTVLKGSTGILFSPAIANLPAKIIIDYRRGGANRPLLKGASVDTELYIGEDHLNSLSELKSKPELIGEIISLLQSPAKNVISALQSSKDKLAGILKTLSEKEN